MSTKSATVISSISLTRSCIQLFSLVILSILIASVSPEKIPFFITGNSTLPLSEEKRLINPSRRWNELNLSTICHDIILFSASFWKFTQVVYPVYTSFVSSSVQLGV